MKILHKTISLFFIIAILLNTTACNKLSKTFSSSKASASNVNADSIINDANKNAQKIDKIESANINVDFSFTPTSNNTIKGKCELDTFVTDMKSHLSTTLIKNDSPLENNIYLDNTNLILAPDGTDYYKFDLSTNKDIAPKLNTILNFVKDINNTEPKPTSSNHQDSADSNFINGTDFQNILKVMLNISNSLTLDGTKTIYDHEMYVLKATITNEDIKSILNTSSYSSNISKNILSKLIAVNGIDVELYITKSGENIVGFYVNLSNITSTFFNVESSDSNYIQILFGLNTSKEFQIPYANEIGIMDAVSLISKIYNSLDDSSELREILDIGNIFNIINHNDILNSIDIKKIVLTIIKNYVFGESEATVDPNI